MDNRIFEDGDGIDEDYCLEVYENDLSLYRLVLDTFYNEILKNTDEIQRMYDAGDVENYRILVHGLKGSGGSVGATRLVDIATKSNALIRDGKWEEAAAFHDPLIAELKRLINLIPGRIGTK